MVAYLSKAQWEFWIHGRHVYGMSVTRMVGIESLHGSPNSLAMSIVVSLPFALFLWSYRREITDAWPVFYTKWFPRILIYYFILATTSVILTNSRSGMLSFIVFLGITALRGKKFTSKLKYIFSAILVLVLIWQFMPAENRTRLETVWNPQAGPANAQASAEGRIEGLVAGIDMFKQNVISGVGVGNFIAYRMQYLDEVPLNAHNIAGQILGEAGIIGALSLAGLIFVTWHSAKKLRVNYLQYPEDKLLYLMAGLGFAITNSILLLLFTGLFGHNALRFNWLWLAAFSLLALQYSNKHIETIKKKSENGQIDKY
jgi:O-antigen ligase